MNKAENPIIRAYRRGALGSCIVIAALLLTPASSFANKYFLKGSYKTQKEYAISNKISMSGNNGSNSSFTGYKKIKGFPETVNKSRDNSSSVQKLKNSCDKVTDASNPLKSTNVKRGPFNKRNLEPLWLATAFVLAVGIGASSGYRKNENPFTQTSKTFSSIIRFSLAEGIPGPTTPDTYWIKNPWLPSFDFDRRTKNKVFKEISELYNFPIHYYENRYSPSSRVKKALLDSK